MIYYTKDKPCFPKGSKHPVHYVFLKAKCSLKDQERIIDHFKSVNNDCMIRVKRTKEGTEFMSSVYKQKEMIRYCFDHCEKLIKDYNLKSFEMDLEILQK